MLLIIMHNNQNYLKLLIQLAKKQELNEASIVQRQQIGARLVGPDASFIYSKGSVVDAYDKALVIVTREEKIKNFLKAIEEDVYLDLHNIKDKGFICTLPYSSIKNAESESELKKGGEIKMRICDFLKEDRILLDLKATDKDGAIKEIASLLKDSKEISDFDLFITNVFERESMQTTGIGKEIAIPHARSDASKEFVIAFGRSNQGINFNALDNKPVKFIFLMGTPQAKGLSSYLKVLAHLTRILSKKDFRESLAKASNPQEIIEEFKKIES